MVNRFIGAGQASVRQLAGHPASRAFFAHRKVNDFITTAHRTLLICGVAAMTLLCVMFFKPQVADQLISLSPFAAPVIENDGAGNNADDAYLAREVAASTPAAMPAIPAGMPAKQENATKMATLMTETHVTPATDNQQKRVIYWLSKRYRLAGDAANMLVTHTYQTAHEIKLDPLLILAVIAIESGFNPYAESPVGAQGLMQVMSKIHHEKFQYLGGLKAALNPLANIKVGSLILKDYVNRGGSVEAGLKTYVGAAAFENDAGYGSKVLAEYRRLKEVATGKNVPVFTTTANSGSNAAQKPKPIERAEPKLEVHNEAALSNREQLQSARHLEAQIAAL